MSSPRRFVSTLLLTAGVVSVLGGCATRSGLEYGAEEAQERGPTNILTQERIAEYPSNWSIEEVMVQGLPGLVLTSQSSGQTATVGSERSYNVIDGPSQYISMRGISGGPALIIVDGVPQPENASQIGLNPVDVSRIEVLRDAASTAQYGFRGGNGVILITTKRGERSAN